MGDFTRRQFVALSAKGVALASIPLVFRANPLAALAPGLEDGGKLADYMTHFGVDEDLIRKVLSVALSNGGDYCDIFFQHGILSYLALEDDVVNRAYTNVDFGVGIRVLKGDQTGYSFSEEITPEAMEKAAKTASNIASGGGNTTIPALGFLETPNRYPVDIEWGEVGVDQRIPYLLKINEKMKARDSRIVKSRASFSDSNSYMMVANSVGRIACDYQPMARVGGDCTIEIDGRRESNGYNYSGRYGIEFFTDDKLDNIAAESVARTLILFDAIKPDAGEMEVVLAAGSSGILLHEAIGHGMEADFNRKGTSIFSDKIGKPVAQNFVSIVDDGTNPNVRGSLNVDDEGNEVGLTYMVRDGVLESYLHDHISSKHYGVKPTGNGRRESFRYPPLPRMRNTYMMPGPHSRDEIIRSVKKGVFVEEFTNGEVAIGPGDFTFYVKRGNLIEDGKITAPIKDINLIGNGPDVLSKVVMVADDFKMAEGGWTCGKNGQGVPVSMGLPTVKVSSITVGGISSRPGGVS